METKLDFWEVGGCIRDEILGIPSKDVDFAISGLVSFDQMREGLQEKSFEIFLETEEFLTIRAKVPKTMPELLSRTKVADFVMCRKDSVSSDGRRPESVEPGTIFDDLSRRDFTMNAIAKNVTTGEIIDPHNGIGDLDRQTIRFVGDPKQRIREDGLRVLRALRFSITKQLRISSEANSAIRTQFAATMLKRVSVERIGDELAKMFAADTIGSMNLLASLPEAHKKALFRDNLRMMPTMRDRIALEN